MTAFDDAWRTWITALTHRLPGAETRYAPPADPRQVQRMEVALESPLPDQLRALYSRHDGEGDQGVPGTFLNLKFLSLAASLRVTETYREIRASGIVHDEGELDPRLRAGFPHPGHVPVFSDMTGNYLGVDVDPGPAGTAGQVLLFGADVDDVEVVFGDLAGCLTWAAALLSSDRVVTSGGRWPTVAVAGARTHAAETLLDHVTLR